MRESEISCAELSLSIYKVISYFSEWTEPVEMLKERRLWHTAASRSTYTKILLVCQLIKSLVVDLHNTVSCKHKHRYMLFSFECVSIMPQSVRDSFVKVSRVFGLF